MDPPCLAGLVNEGQGFELVGCQLEIGVKKGIFKGLNKNAKA